MLHQSHDFPDSADFLHSLFLFPRFVDAVFNDSSGPSDRAGRVFVPQTGPGIRVSVCERGSGYR